MRSTENNYAFIDSQNVNLGIQELGWNLNWKRFRVYLAEKYGIKKAYLFLGFVPENQAMYSFLQSAGFVLIFKPTFRNQDGKVKGNCDADLVLQAMIDFSAYRNALIVSGDGDFYCLVDYLRRQGKLLGVLVPNELSYSGLLKKTAKQQLSSMNSLREKLEYKKKSTP